MFPNPGKVIGIITTDELSFMVQEPSGIIPLASPQSLSASLVMQRMNSVSDCIELKISWVMKSVLLVKSAGIPLKEMSSKRLGYKQLPTSSLLPFKKANISIRSARSSIVVVSLILMPTNFSSTFRRLISLLWNSDKTQSEVVLNDLEQSIVRVSKKLVGWLTTSIPSSLNSSLRTSALNLKRLAIYLRPAGLCQIPYIAVILARRAYEVQILEVALSRLMCYSRT